MRVADTGLRPNRKFRALVIDDESAIRNLIVRALEGRHLESHGAGDARQAEELLDTNEFDVVVVDLRLPDRKGQSLASDLIRRRPRPLVVVVTGVLDSRITDDLLARGVDDIHFKPLEYGLLSAKIALLLERRRTRESSISALPNPAQNPVQITSGATVASKIDADAIEKRLSRVTQLIPSGKSALDVVQATGSGSVDHEHLTACIARDPALIVEVLRAAARRSGLAEPTSGDDRLSAAVSRLGPRMVHDLAVASSTAAEIYSDLLPWSDGELAWRRGLASALACERLNHEMSLNGKLETVFLAALLRPLGRVQLASMYSQEYEQIVGRARDRGEPLTAFERSAFGLTPDEVLARLLARWSIAPAICEILELASLDFPAVERLPAPLKQQLMMLKVAGFLGELAVGGWEPWDTLDVLPEPLLIEVCSVVPATIVRRVRGDLMSLAMLRRTLVAADCESTGELDGSEPALVNLGQPAVEAVERFIEALETPRRFVKLPTRAISAYTGPLIVNACCASPVELRRLADMKFCGPRLIVKSRGKFRLQHRQVAVLELPCSWQTFCLACERLLDAAVPTTRSLVPMAGPIHLAPVADAVLA